MAHILLIEDNPANLELMVYLLQAFGHTPLTAHDGATGLAAARQQAPNLILCDIQLPDLDGYAVARFLSRPIEPETLLREIAACLGEPRERG